MMSRRARLLARLAGVALGLVLAVALFRQSSPMTVADAGPTLSDCDGALRSIVIQYTPAARDIVVGPYRQLLAQLPPDVEVLALCPDEAAFAELAAAVGGERLTPAIAGHPITAWARDRFLVLAPRKQSQPAMLVAPALAEGEEVWPGRAGDLRVADDLAAAWPPRFVARRASFGFDGGDFVADDETVFVAPRLWQRESGLAGPARFQADLAAMLKRRVVLLPMAPPHHAGMYMMAVGERRMLVGDPSLGRQALGPTDVLPLTAPDFSAAAQEACDAVADACFEAGYEVTRLPIAIDADGRTYLTWTNVIIDQRDGRRTVYLPTYAGVEALNAMAQAVWEGLGFTVKPVDCTSAYPCYGSLRCLVAVVDRGH